MNAKIILIPLSILLHIAFFTGQPAESNVNSAPGASIRLLPVSTTFATDEVLRGAIAFTASIRNDGTKAITIAHPSVCFPADYKQGETRHLKESHGKSEILLMIRKPDGADVVLRDGNLHLFDPGHVPLLTIPPNGTGKFHIGWFFQNARGRWEQDDQAAKVFLDKGQYKIRTVFRNVFPKAVLYDENTRKIRFIEVWTGEMESAEITIEVK